MNDLCTKVSDSELKLLNALWRAGKPLKLSELRKAVTAATGWEGAMVKTLLYRLVDKGVVASEKRESFYFTPNISERDYHRYATRTFTDKLFGGSVKGLVASLMDTNRLSDEEILELREMFKVGDEP